MAEPARLSKIEIFFATVSGKIDHDGEGLKGGDAKQVISLTPGDFKGDEGESLATWQNVDVLSLRAYHDKAGKLIGSKNWAAVSRA